MIWYRAFDFVWFRQPCTETDLGDGRTGIESDHFAKRHIGGKKSENIPCSLFIPSYTPTLPVRVTARPDDGPRVVRHSVSRDLFIESCLVVYKRSCLCETSISRVSLYRFRSTAESVQMRDCALVICRP